MSGCDTNPAPGPPTPGALPSDPAPSTGRLWQSTPPAAPAMPVAAQGTGPRAAKAFARHYFEVINYAATSGDTEVLKRLASTSCASCTAVTDNIDRIYSAGGHVERERWVVRSVRVLQARPDHTVASLDAFIGPAVIVLGSGKRQIHKGGRQPMTMFIKFRKNRPVVTQLELVAS